MQCPFYLLIELTRKRAKIVAWEGSLWALCSFQTTAGCVRVRPESCRAMSLEIHLENYPKQSSSTSQLFSDAAQQLLNASSILNVRSFASKSQWLSRGTWLCLWSSRPCCQIPLELACHLQWESRYPLGRELLRSSYLTSTSQAPLLSPLLYFYCLVLTAEKDLLILALEARSSDLRHFGPPFSLHFGPQFNLHFILQGHCQA